MSVSPIPEGFHTLTPYLIFKDAGRAIDFYRQAFGATELFRETDAAGRIRHAHIRIGDSMLMLAEEAPEWPAWQSAETRGGSPIHLYVYVEDADAIFERAIAAGGTVLLPMEDHDYGDRSGGLVDPFGFTWYIATHQFDVTG